MLEEPESFRVAYREAEARIAGLESLIAKQRQTMADRDQAVLLAKRWVDELRAENEKLRAVYSELAQLTEHLIRFSPRASAYLSGDHEAHHRAAMRARAFLDSAREL